MFSSKKLAALALLLASSAQLNKAARVNCDPKNRPDPDTCYTDEYLPTCGYYTKGCPFSICGTTQASPCYACADPNVLYYEDGECKSSQEVWPCSNDICDPDMGGDAYELAKWFNPMCGVKKSCSGSGDCDKTFDTVCKSCAASSYIFYQNGPCENDRTYCSARRPTSCSSTNSKVCAYFTGADGEKHFATVNGACNACKDKNVEYHIPGACGGTPYEYKSFCLPNNRPTSCAADSNKVCAFTGNGVDGYNHKIVANACTACRDKKVVYHTPGPCVFMCDRNPFKDFDCAGELKPACGTYKQNGVTKKVSFRSGCIGCYSAPMLIDSYTEGLCPGDDGILCANNGGMALMEGFLNPVCGLTRLNCNSASCRKTYADSYSVCDGTNVVKYLPGPCPGDVGVPCTDFRPSKAGDAPFIFENVCGYTSKTCNSNSCRKNYADQIQACANSKVLYFKAGPC